ncbi:hypothetical protein PFISCL1PPCAC_6923, partial [Pristionchus fissidentatus]
VFLFATTADAKSIRLRREIPAYSNDQLKPAVEPPLIQVSGASPNSYYISANIGKNDESEIAAYQSMLEILLRQLSTLDTEPADPKNPTSSETAQEYQRDFLSQQAYDVVNRLLQLGALSAIADAEKAVYGDEGSPETEEVEKEAIVDSDSTKIMSGPDDYDGFGDDQAREVLRLLIDELMDKFFADSKNTQVFVLGASSKKSNDEMGEEEDMDDSSDSSSSESDEGDSDEYYYYSTEEDTDGLQPADADDDAVILVNKQVTTNLIRIPSQTFLNALAKLGPEIENKPTHTALTPLQVEDPRVYAKPTSGSNPLIDPPMTVPGHSGHSRPIIPVATAVPSEVAPAATAAAAAAAPSTES